MNRTTRVTTLLLCLAAASPVLAADRGLTQLSALSPSLESMPANASKPLTLSAPPRGSEEEGRARFQPIAEHLSSVLGRKVVYRHPGTWGAYQAAMQAGELDIVFDGAHFVSWRINRTGHTAMLRLPGEFVYTAFVRKDEPRFHSLNDLNGRRFCAHAPPNLGTLIMYDAFPNPARQPALVLTTGYKNIYEAVLAGKCEAGMLPTSYLKKFDPQGERMRVVYTTKSMPEQAWTAGPRVSTAEREKIVEALQSPNAREALRLFVKTYGLDRDMVRASNAEYAGLERFLAGLTGF